MSSSDTPQWAIEVRGLTKCYEIGDDIAATRLSEWLQERVAGLLRKLRSTQRSRSRSTFRALRDVSFSVSAGEVVGIVGDNGAGKSTLLKILSRVTEPTEGSVVYRGRVGSLLEVGTGFHPDLNGRDNIYLSGAILGMSRAEIDRHLEEIIDFSELSTFIDTPVKRYSSGMYMRLAFSVAAHLDTDILLIDEVLAVGDYKFQEKCLARIGGIAEQGRTIIFVSHNLLAVRSLCSRVIWMHEGKVEADGPTDAVIGQYLRRDGARGASRRNWPEDDTAPGDHQLRLRSAVIQAADVAPDRPIDVTTPFVITVTYDNFLDGAQINLAIVVVDEMGTIIFSAGPTAPPFDQAVGRYSESCHVPGNLMNDGNYFISVEVREKAKLLLSLPAVLSISIEDSSEGRHGWFGKWEGAVRPRLEWTTELLGDAP